MSSPWSAPDGRRAAAATSLRLGEEPTRRRHPPLLADLLAGLLTMVICVLVAAPVGLLWAALAPRVQLVASGNSLDYADVYGSSRIAADGYFLFAVLLAGVVAGVLAWLLGRQHGPAVVLGLAIGGVLAAAVAQQVGSLVGTDLLSVVAQARSGARGNFELSVGLQAHAALAGWSLGALLTYLAAMLIGDRRPTPVSSD